MMVQSKEGSSASLQGISAVSFLAADMCDVTASDSATDSILDATFASDVQRNQLIIEVFVDKHFDNFTSSQSPPTILLAVPFDISE